MINKLISFGFKHGPPKTSYIIDIREMFKDNPYYIPELRQFNGTHIQIQEYLRKNPDFNYNYTNLKNTVDLTNKIWRRYPINLYIGCTGGHHRSVALVEFLGKDLNISIAHRDIHREEIK